VQKIDGINPCFFVNDKDKKYRGLLHMEKNKSFYRDKAKKIMKCINFISRHYEEKKPEEEQLIEDLKKAQREWKMKEEYFQWATDPDLIEHAIYELKASKIKYIYFLKKAKELGIK